VGFRSTSAASALADGDREPGQTLSKKAVLESPRPEAREVMVNAPGTSPRAITPRSLNSGFHPPISGSMRGVIVQPARIHTLAHAEPRIVGVFMAMSLRDERVTHGSGASRRKRHHVESRTRDHSLRRTVTVLRTSPPAAGTASGVEQAWQNRAWLEFHSPQLWHTCTLRV
jgi:hypothetical protein